MKNCFTKLFSLRLARQFLYNLCRLLQMRQYKKVVSYLKASYLLHAITIFEIIFFSSLYYFIDVVSWFSSSDYMILKLLAISPSICMPLFAQLDARSRFQNYKLVKDHLYLYGFQPRILKPFLKSRCQRDAAIAAANELGLSNHCREYFRGFGYKWYHLFPDIIFKQPSVLLTKNFWLTTLFTKTYHPKIDFETIDLMEVSEKNMLSAAKTSLSF
jgi:hypothetical protein